MNMDDLFICKSIDNFKIALALPLFTNSIILLDIVAYLASSK